MVIQMVIQKVIKMVIQKVIKMVIQKVIQMVIKIMDGINYNKNNNLFICNLICITFISFTRISIFLIVTKPLDILVANLLIP